MAKKKYSVVSLFSGAMGLDLGLEQTERFRVLACVEVEPAFCDTIRANQRAGNLSKRLKVYQTDINDLDPSTLMDELGLKPGDLDLLAGGPPCQSFSTAGRRRTTQDPRGTLLWQFLRFVEVMKPKFFLIENVRGLISAALNHRPIAERPHKGGPPLAADEQPGSVVRRFSDDLQGILDAAYHMDCFEVNAVNYGAPQLRERALFIGNRYNAVVNFPDPTHGVEDDPDREQSLFADLETPLTPWATLREAIGDLSESDPVIMDFSPRKKKYLSMVPPGSNWRSLPTDLQKESMGRAWFAKGGRSGWWRRLTFDLPCPTLVTMPNHASTSLCHPTETRALTLREYAHIQEFPTDWQVCGTPSEQYAQIGNAVPVRLGTVAGETIAEQLHVLRSRKWVGYPNKPQACRIIYVQSHVRTRQWFKSGETFVWDDGGSNGNAAYSRPKTKRRAQAL
ncbi:MAG TPA: DNA cytosine methyltransferase [Phycisphaerae bacterium]|nr:DNA cytosine methyltransferase [Phycisphaerae bacterium]